MLLFGLVIGKLFVCYCDGSWFVEFVVVVLLMLEKNYLLWICICVVVGL